MIKYQYVYVKLSLFQRLLYKLMRLEPHAIGYNRSENGVKTLHWGKPSYRIAGKGGTYVDIPLHYGRWK